MKKLLSILAIMLITLTAYSVSHIPESVKVPKSGKTMLLEAGQIAVVKVIAPEMPGWDNKMIIVEAINDVEISDTITVPQLGSGDFEIQREAVAKLGGLLPWTYDKNRNEPQLYLPSGEWVRHNRYKPMPNGLFFIKGEEIKTIERWEELNGGEGVFDQEIQDALYAARKTHLENKIKNILGDILAQGWDSWNAGFTNTMREIGIGIYEVQVVVVHGTSLPENPDHIFLFELTIDFNQYSSGIEEISNLDNHEMDVYWAEPLKFKTVEVTTFNVIGTFGEYGSVEILETGSEWVYRD